MTTGARDRGAMLLHLILTSDTTWYVWLRGKPASQGLGYAEKGREIQFKICKEPVLNHLIIPRPVNLVLVQLKKDRSVFGRVELFYSCIETWLEDW
jgi:hypothetical protein